MLLASLGTLAVAQSPALGGRPTTLSGKSAFGDWRMDAPLVRRKIAVDDLPAPHATRSAFNFSRIVPKPASAAPKVPPGFRADLLISALQDPRVLRIAPNGDVFIAESAAGRIRVLRIAENTGQVSSNHVFASGLNSPFGMAFYPPGSQPQWLYVANVTSVVRYRYATGDQRAREKPEITVPQLRGKGNRSTQRGHITRDIAFSTDGARLFVSVGSASNDARASAGAIRRR